MSICQLRDQNEQSILESCVEAFKLQSKIEIPKLIRYCEMKYTPTDEEQLWAVLWCKSNLILTWCPRDNAFRWEGKTYRDKSYLWEIH